MWCIFLTFFPTQTYFLYIFFKKVSCFYSGKKYLNFIFLSNLVVWQPLWRRVGVPGPHRVVYVQHVCDLGPAEFVNLTAGLDGLEPSSSS